MEITDANLRRLQETLSGNNRSSGSTNDSNRPSGGSTNINFPATASSGFQQQQQQPNHYVQAGNSRSENQPPSIPKAVVEEKKPNFDVSEYEVDGLLPPIPKSFTQIDNMPLSELKELVDDKALLQSFVESTSEVKTLAELKESFETSNVDAACTNLENEEKLNTICTEVETLKGDLDTKMEKRLMTRVSARPGDPSGTNRRPLQSLVRNGQQACRTSTRKVKGWPTYERDCCKLRSSCRLQTLKVLDAIRKVHDTQSEILWSWSGSAKPKDGEKFSSYDEVWKRGTTNGGKGAAWLEAAQRSRVSPVAAHRKRFRPQC